MSRMSSSTSEHDRAIVAGSADLADLIIKTARKGLDQGHPPEHVGAYLATVLEEQTQGTIDLNFHALTMRYTAGIAAARAAQAQAACDSLSRTSERAATVYRNPAEPTKHDGADLLQVTEGHLIVGKANGSVNETIAIYAPGCWTTATLDE
jgi:hypothetical protein